MKPSFNVLKEPWIPTRSRSGQLAEYGILDTLRFAHELVAVEDPSPAFQFGIYRLLVAFVMDALKVRRQRDLEDLLAQGRLDLGSLEEYARVCGDCFDLFNDLRPFLQTGSASVDGQTSVAALFQHIPSGTNAVHFHHGLEDEQAVSPAICARGLAAIAPFMTAGGQGKSPSINGAPPWYVLVRGQSLFGTLVLNCCAVPIPWSKAGDHPSWSSVVPVQPKEQVREFSLLEGLTWRPRIVRLFPDTGGRCTYSGRSSPVLVRRIVFGAGLRAVVEDGRWVDPNVAYRITEKGRFPMRPAEDHPVWRDTGPLLLLREQDLGGEVKVRFERPLVVSQFVQLEEWKSPGTGRPLQVECYGMRTDNMKIFEWQSETLSLPSDVLRHPKAGVQVQRAMELCDELADALRKSVRQAYPREGKSNAHAFEGLITTATTHLWQRLRPRFETEFLAAVANQRPDDVNADATLLAFWFEIALQEARASLDLVLDSLDSDAQALRRQVEAHDLFWKLVNAKRPGRKSARTVTRKSQKLTKETAP